MGTVELVALVTTLAGFLSPRVIAMVPGGRAAKQRAGTQIAAGVAFIVSIIESGIFDGFFANGFNWGSIVAFIVTAGGTKGGQQAFYDGYYNKGDKDKPEDDVVASMNAQREPTTGQVTAVMDVPAPVPARSAEPDLVWAEEEPTTTFVAAVSDAEWGPVETESQDDPEGFEGGWEYELAVAQQGEQ